MGGFSNVLGSLSVVIGADIDDYLTDLAKVGDEAGKAVGEVQKQFGGLTEIGTQIAGLGAGLTAGITVPLVGLGALAVGAAADMDSLMRGLTAVAGSSDEAAKQMARLKDVAKLPGLALEEAVQGSIRLQSVGVSADQAERTMRAFGNALATVGKGAPDLEAVISQLVQMSSKTNVVAEDLKPIMERVPQVAAIMKQEFGTINTEVLQKLGVSTKEFTDKVIAGLERLPAVSGGVKNAMENLSDSSKAALTSIGQSLIPVLEKLTPVIEGVLAGVVRLAEWFRNLPGPVQAAVGAVVAFAAALGPVLVAVGGLTAAVGAAMPALTSLALFFGTSVAGLGTWTATIGLAVAALAILTTQATDTGNAARELYDALNMTSEAGGASKGIIDQLSESLRGMFGVSDQANKSLKEVNATVTESSGLTKFFSDKLEELRLKWEAFNWTDYISPLGVLNKLLRDTAEVVSTIRGVFPDMEKAGTKALESLQKANQKSASDAAANAMALDAMAKKQREAAEAATKTEAAQKKAAAAAAKAAKAAGDHARAVADAWDAAYKRYDKAAKDAEANRKWFEQAYQKIEQLDRQLEASARQLSIEFGKAHEAMRKAATETVDVIIPLTKRIPPEVQAVIKANKDLENAYKELGVTSSAELDKQWLKAKEAYDKITASGTASANDIDRAWVEMEKRRQEAVFAEGGIITAEQKKTLEKMEEQLDTSGKKQKDKWSEWSKQVSTIVTDLGRDLAGILFDGDKSWAEKGRAALDALGQAVSRAFIEPATAAIGDFIGGALADLMGGKGFGGLADRIKDIGESFSKIFGGGTDVAEKVSDSVPGADKVPGLPGAGAAAGAGLAGIVTAVSGVVSAVSGVIGNFQFAAMNKSLDLIEHETRYAQIHLRHILEDGVNKWLPKLAEIAGFNWDVLAPALASLMSTAESIPDRLYDLTRWAVSGVDATRENGALLAEIRDLLGARPAAVTINISGAASPAATADAVALKLQGVML